MKLIADSGSTKTHWVIILPEGQIKSLYSQGINPYFLDVDEISRIVKECFIAFPTGEIKEVYFYGAGCSIAEKCSQVAAALSVVFPSAKIVTHSDLLAAAHALFGKANGVVSILGTGSNAAVYNGKDFEKKIQSLGYLLGDEGSGSYIGRQLLQSYLRKEMPSKLRNEFRKDFELELPFVLEHLYKKAFPNRYLASFATFASKFREDDFIQNILRNSFQDFIHYQLDVLDFDKNIPVGFVGSVAFYFQEILKDELIKSGYQFAQVLKNPIEQLQEYYK